MCSACMKVGYNVKEDKKEKKKREKTELSATAIVYMQLLDSIQAPIVL